MEDPVIEITNEDIFDNFDEIISESHMFTLNSNISKVNTFIFYVDRKEIVNYKRYEVDIDENTLKKKELLSLVLNNNKYYSNTYDLIGIYKYGFNISEKELKDFCVNTDNFNFIESFTKVQDITFDPSIEMFKANNCLFLFFSKKNKPRQQPKKQQDKTNEETDDSSDNKKFMNKNKTLKKVRFDLETRNKTLKKLT
tara:strand:- start:2364 stop:2954 length:591 start_codon:yes stop_codon:yes gene_type:complete